MANAHAKIWKVVLAALCVSIVGLTAGILLTKNLRHNSGEYESNIDLVEQAQREISELNHIDISKAIEIYQSYIDRADGNTKIELYRKRIRYVMDHDIEKDYDQQVINDYIAIDDALQTSSSAMEVVNILYFYKNYGDLLDKYTNLLHQREETEGVDPDMETVG